MVVEVKGTRETIALFGDWQETMIWSCVQGVMGHLYANAKENPKSVMAILGDFCFFAGRPCRELVAYKPEWATQEFIIMTADTPGWFPLIEEVYAERAKKVSRYAIKKEKDIFDREKLNRLVSMLPSDYQLCMIDQTLYERCRQQAWSHDLVAQYADYEEYQRLGLGVAVLKGDELVAGASSYSSYRGGIEIEIDTRLDVRRQGLAAACGAKLILACLKRGWYPSWDAQNLWSVALAEKLGYHFEREYTAYEIQKY